MNFYKHPDCYSELRQLYWKLRNRRAYDLAKRQRCYRAIRKERARLVAEGYASEHVRLYCRWMANPNSPFPERRLRAYEQSVIEYAAVLGRIRGTNTALDTLMGEVENIAGRVSSFAIRV